jgi:glutathione S-transferase
MRSNPLGKIPALILDDGRTVYDSQVICEYLDGVGTGPVLFPKDWADRLPTLTLGSLADGILEAAVLLVYEKRFRPEDKWVTAWQERQQAKIDRALAALAADPPNWKGQPDYGHLTLASALGYLDFRHAGTWRGKYPALVAWLDKYAAAVPAFADSTPS